MVVCTNMRAFLLLFSIALSYALERKYDESAIRSAIVHRNINANNDDLDKIKEDLAEKARLEYISLKFGDNLDKIKKELEEQSESDLIAMYDDLDNKKEDPKKKTRRETVVPEPAEAWTGKWFPLKATDVPPTAASPPSRMNENSMWRMINATCDDGKQNLTVDWEMNSYDYECESSRPLIPDTSLKAILEDEHLPPAYVARHVCMKSKIEYDQPLPTYGPHRPAWAKYGEYKFLPIQRFLHNLEHGAIVMLYHPCANPSMVNKLKKIVKSCLYRHVISASRLVPPERPFALISWGWRMLMPTVNTKLAVEFIREHALHGYEWTHRDGYYDQLLIAPAQVVSTKDDRELCPKYKGNDV